MLCWVFGCVSVLLNAGPMSGLLEFFTSDQLCLLLVFSLLSHRVHMLIPQES